jgi:isopenicillin N synthase-like dioxygenase
MPSGDTDPPSAHVPWSDDLPTAPMPVIDWLALTSDDPVEHAAELAKLESVARTVGFFFLKNAPIKRSKLSDQLDLAKRLFELPEGEKEPLNMGIKGEHGAEYRSELASRGHEVELRIWRRLRRSGAFYSSRRRGDLDFE